MKLNKAKKERIETYLDMLEFHCDIRSMFMDDDRLNIIEGLNGILNENYYAKMDKPQLNSLERKYQLIVLKKNK
jgi:hypothetical protein